DFFCMIWHNNVLF
nr:immunoglobulin light chain junction region [Macaca mulatta]